MKEISLNGKWKMKNTTESDWTEANVPGSVICDLLSAGKIDDPYYRDNEDYTKKLTYFDYEYEKSFEIDNDIVRCDQVVLVCEGLDTITDIFLNKSLIAKTNNMHRTYEFDIKKTVQNGLNNIRIVFYSPIRYVEKKQKEFPLHSPIHAIRGLPHLRKGHSMFGWDADPQIPDSGIWRNIGIRGYNTARLEDVYITQRHETRKALMDVRVRTKYFRQECVSLDVKIYSPGGSIINKTIVTQRYEEHLYFEIENPMLWWPNGYGEQSLYKVEVILKKDEETLDKRVMNIGLRTLTIRREKDCFGESFQFEINGMSIFAMGANYIPEDKFLPRCNRQRTERLIKDCVEANFNCIRVWGGGIYPEDYFFDLCDKYGLIVWQDFMFACSTYDVNEEFIDNVTNELIDNIKRIRHHACLGLWCGNNEIESMLKKGNFVKTPRNFSDYIKLFEFIIPDIVKKCDPNTFYWPSTPSSGGGFFDVTEDENRGDAHYWEVWHGNRPYTEYKTRYFRFVSEFGIQSFPSMKTIESFTVPEDRNVFSRIMEKHQKNQHNTGNQKIMNYVFEDLRYPTNLELAVYASQLVQAEAIRCGVEHWRRNRGRCMGALYWQLNDCWPGSTWSGIDYYGRWKALHYFAKRFFAPVLISANAEKRMVDLYVVNDTTSPVNGVVIWQLKDHESKVIKEGSLDVQVEALTAKICKTLDFSSELALYGAERKIYLEYSIKLDNGYTSEATLLFIKPKHFDFLNPDIDFNINEHSDRFEIILKSTAYAKYVELDLKGMDVRFSDNYFDLSAGDEKKILIMKENLSESTSQEQLKELLIIRSVYDIR